MRTKLSTVIGKYLHLRKPTDEEQKEIGIEHSTTLLLCDSSDRPLIQVEIDDLFDHEGNRFEVDIDL